MVFYGQDVIGGVQLYAVLLQSSSCIVRHQGEFDDKRGY